MTLIIELSPDLERRLAERAASEGTATTDLVRQLLEQGLNTGAPNLENQPVHPEIQRLKWSSEKIQAFLQSHPAAPSERGEQPTPLVWPEDEDVDEFLAERRVWHRPERYDLSESEVVT